MTLEELNAARDTATRQALIDGGILEQAKALLEAIPQLGAVGESAGHVQATLRHFVTQAEAFALRSAPVEIAPAQPLASPVE
jgi:hypothetical protein